MICGVLKTGGNDVESIRGWTMPSRHKRPGAESKFDNITIASPGLYMVYAKIAYVCSGSSTTKPVKTELKAYVKNGYENE
jgi:hypothetical protein